MTNLNPQTPTRLGITLAGSEHRHRRRRYRRRHRPENLLFVHVGADGPIDPVGLTISSDDGERLSRNLDTNAVSEPGLLIIARPSERPSSRYVIATEFDEVIADLTDYVDNTAAALTTASAGDYASYDDANTRWQHGGTLADLPDVALAPGATWTGGRRVPGSSGELRHPSLWRCRSQWPLRLRRCERYGPDERGGRRLRPVRRRKHPMGHAGQSVRRDGRIDGRNGLPDRPKRRRYPRVQPEVHRADYHR